MRIAILSDVHSNLEALDAVLARAAEAGASSTLVLGDIVGYNADPREVVERLVSLPNVTLLAGNHDLAATDRFDVTWFNSVAAAAIRWTAQALGPDALQVLRGLVPRVETAEALLVHGSVRDPAAEYVVNAADAQASFDAEEFSLCFFGHTHLPASFVADGSGNIVGRPLSDGETVSLEPGSRVMLNPGSVGQPRDSDPRASFMIYDTDEASAVVHRVAYDLATTQLKIRAVGLPDVLADRLAVGR